MSNNPTKFGTAKYDTAVFDIESEDATFYSDVRIDINDILNDYGTWFHIVRQSKTYDGMGAVNGVTEYKYNVNGWISPLTSKDYNRLGYGIASKGSAKIILKHEYTNDNNQESFIPKVGDIFRSNQQRWEIKDIVNREVRGRIVFKVAIVSQLNNEVTE